MQASLGQRVLRWGGVLSGLAGLGAWGQLMLQAFSGIEEVAPENEEGARFMAWAVGGTVLMIVGTLLLHLSLADPEEEPDRTG